MADLKAGKAWFEIFLDDKALRRGLSATQKQLTSWASGLRQVGQTLGAISTIGAVAFAPAVAAASSATEVMSKFEVVFGKGAPAMKAWGDALAQQIGRAKTDVAEFVAGAQDLFIPIGFDEASATKMSKVVTQLAFDLASFNNQLDADAMRDIQAALTGSGEVMKKYGVIVSETTVKQQLMNQGFSKERANGASEQEKVLARLAIILKGTTAAQGDAVRTAGSFANQMKALKGAGKDALEAIGQPLTEALIPYVEFLRSGVRAIAQFASANSGMASTAIAVGVGIGAAAVAAIGLSIGLSSLANVIGTVMAVGAGITALFGTLVSVVAAIGSPLSIAIAFIAGIAAVMIDWQKVTVVVVEFIGSRFAGLSEIIGKTFKVMKDAMVAGDFVGAANVLWSSLNLAWVQGTQQLNKAWASSMQFMQTTWIAVVNNMQRMFLSFNTSVAQAFSTFGAGLNEIAANVSAFLGLDDAAADFRTYAEVWVQGSEKLQADHEAAMAAIQVKAQEKLSAIYQGSDEDISKAKQELQRARQDWNIAIQRASASNDNPNKSLADPNPAPLNLDGITAGIASAGKEIDKVVAARGTFSADAERILGGTDSVSKKQLEEQKKANQLLAAIADAADNGGLVFAN